MIAMNRHHTQQSSKPETQTQTKLTSDGTQPAEFYPMDILHMQRTVGNAAVQRLIKNGQLKSIGKAQHLVQRDPPTTTGGNPFPQPDPVLDPFINQTYQHADGRFYLRYFPLGSRPYYVRPIEGLATATLRLHVEFQNFDVIKDQEPYKDMIFTPQQQAEFIWTDAEKDTFQQNLEKSTYFAS
jgi:hypothetical protein